MIALRKKNGKQGFGRLRESDTTERHIPADKTWPWDRYSHTDIHWRLLEVTETDRTKTELKTDELNQALFCPYYVPLEGVLGADWGVVVNPRSVKFGKLVFEHWDCGCPVEESGYPHVGAAQQELDAWNIKWRHRCDNWCDAPCESRDWI